MKSIAFVKTEESMKRMLHRASVSGAIWRSHEIFALAGHDLKRPILDLGCGDGRYAKWVLNEKMDIGLDISRSTIEKAVKNNAYEKYIIASASKIPLENSWVNTIFSNSAFEHFKNLDTALSEMNRVLKKNGILIFTTHSPISKKFNSARFLKKLGFTFLAKIVQKIFVRQLQLNSLRTQKKWAELLQSRGFTILEFKNLVSERSFFFYEMFMPFTFIQNRISLLKVIPFASFVLTFFNIDYTEEVKNGYNFLIVSKKNRPKIEKNDNHER